jgi:poly-beta-1,6-N-acetyl-D-glucosamine synthase
MATSVISSGPFRYALVTAARNEKECIGACIESVVHQSVQPTAWIIVSDGSTDCTESIIEEYAKQHNFIRLLRKKTDRTQSGFSSKVFALGMGAECIKINDLEFIGHLDADITVEKEYYARILSEFKANPKLGLAGGYIFEREGGEFRSRSSNSPWSVAGGIQLFRSECYIKISPLKPLPLGGEDWHAEIEARMQGWEVKAFSDIVAYHHKSSRSKRGIIKEGLRLGALDYAIGTHPLFELLKCMRRMKEKPLFLYASLMLWGFFEAYLTRQNRGTTKEIVNYLQREQLMRIRAFFSCNSHINSR